MGGAISKEDDLPPAQSPAVFCSDCCCNRQPRNSAYGVARPAHVWYLWSEMISTGQHQNASGFQIGRLRGDYPVSALGYSSSAHAARRKKAADQVLWPAL
jgi:hypothetical protein